MTDVVELGEVGDAIRGVTFSGGEGVPDELPNMIACLTTSGVQEEVNWKSRRFIPLERIANQKQILHDGDILISTANSKELVGKSCLVRNIPYPCTFGAFVTVFRPNEKIEPNFLAYLMRTSEFLQFCYQASSNTTNISNLRTSELLERKIPLPPLPEQRRIAALLDKADRLRRTRRYAAQLSDTFLQAVFVRMFGDVVKNPMGWELCGLEELGFLGRGMSKNRPRNAPELYGGRYPFIQTGDITNSGGYIRSYTQTYSELGLKQSKMWQKGTLCITIAANIGKTGILMFDSCFPDSVVGFVANEKTNVEFVQWWFSFVQKRLEELAPESAQKNIDLEILRELAVIVPPLTLQQKFARIVQQFERLRAQQREAERQAEHLFQTLLHRAFA